MKKKIFSALLMGVFTLASMSMFVSCKDYDDDINGLDTQQQELLSKLNELESSVTENYTTLNGQLTTATETANKALQQAQQAGADVENLKGLVSDATDAAKNAGTAAADAQTAADNAQAAANSASEDAATAQAAAEAAQKAADDAQATADDALAKAKEALENLKSAATSENVEKALADAANALSQCTDLAERVGKLEAMSDDVADLKEQVANAATKDELSTLQAKVDSLQAYFDSIFSMVTSVSLYASEGLVNGTYLEFPRVIEQENVFPEQKDEVAKGWFIFNEGTVRTYEASLVVRVSPTNAVLNADDITLINSQGVELTDYVTCSKVERYDNLLTRGTTNNGLWKVTFKLDDNYVPANFEAATTTENGTKQVLYAVAVKNTDLDNADRRVISAYDVTVEATPAQYADNDFDLRDSEGDWKNIEKIANRYVKAEDGTYTDGTGDSKVIDELVWNDNKEPATKATDKNSSNRGNNGFDNRDMDTKGTTLLAGEVNKPIEIRIDWDEEADQPKNQIRGFYVTLDSEFAVESAPSELNAWNSYSYEHVGTATQKATMWSGNRGYITINNLNNAAGDVIGFRLYAVNLDGTLLDPDGRAFYVAIGNAATTGTINGNIVATKAQNSMSDYIPVEEGLFIDCDNWSNFTWEASKNNKLVNHDNQTIDDDDLKATLFNVTYYDKNKKEIIITDGKQFEDVAYVRFSMPDAKNFVDGETYSQTLKLYNEVAGQKVLAKTITATMTKVMPGFPKEFAIKIGQTYGGSDNTVRPYFIPTNGWDLSSNHNETGYTDLKNLFDGLLIGSTFDRMYELTFADSKADPKEDGKYIDNDVTYADNAFGTGNAGYKLVVPSELINNEPHAITVSYTYEKVSSYKKNDGSWEVGADYDVDYDGALFAQYACWHMDMYDAEGKQLVDWAKAATTKLNWKHDGSTYTNDGAKVVIGNTRDAEFAGTLASLIKAGYLKVKTGSEKLVAENGSESPYYDVVVDADGTITFTQDPQNKQAPYSDHVETLTFKVLDSFAHEITISLDVEVCNPQLED